MKKFLMLLVVLALAGGVAYYQSRPATMTVPVEMVEDEPTFFDDMQPAIPEEVETTSTLVERLDVDFSNPDLQLEVEGVDGDNLTLREVVSEPQTLDELPEDVATVARGCMGVTDRDMAVQVDSQIELQSGLAADIRVDYGLTGQMGVYDFNDGLTCKNSGGVNHHLEPSAPNHFTFWVILTGAITPNGMADQSWSLNGPLLTLPNLEKMFWQMWGPGVFKCDDLFGGVKLYLAGLPIDTDCYEPAFTQSEAAGNH